MGIVRVVGLLALVSAQVQVDHNLFLVATLEGMIQAVDDRGTQRWAINTGSAFVKTYYSESAQEAQELVIPTVEGDIVVFAQGRFSKSEVDIKGMVEECPRMKDGLYLVGEKKLRAYAVEAQTGRLLAAYQDSRTATIALAALPPRDTLIIGLVDYSVKALDVNTFEPRWNFTYTEMMPTANTNKDSVPERLRTEVDNVVKSLRFSRNTVVSVNALSGTTGLIHPVELRRKPVNSMVKISNSTYGLYADIVDAPSNEEDRASLAPIDLPSISQKALPLPLFLEPSPSNSSTFLLSTLFLVSVFLIYHSYRTRSTPTRSLSLSTTPPTSVILTAPKVANPLKDPPNIKRIGRLVVYLDRKLGDGSHGTAVFEGLFMEREVAVKRMLSNLYLSAKQEISLLLKTDSHPNMVTFHAWEEDVDFLYLVIEKCCGTLGDVIEALAMSNKRKRKTALSQFPVLPNVTSLLYDAAQGLAYLHTKKIVHRDLKPMNILIDARGRAKIADMASAKALRHDQSSYGTQAHGSAGWQPAEVLLNKRRNCSVDIFSLGCTMYSALLPGKHPFGDRLQRDQNIIEGKSDLEGLDPEAHHLISMMISPVPEKRPSASSVCSHPFFWNAEKKLDFLVWFSDRLEAEGNGSQLEVDFEAELRDMLTEPWSQSLDPVFVASLEKYRKYNFVSVKDLLRVIRNKKNHYHNLSDEAKAVVGAIPEGYYNYFLGVYPTLLVRIYAFAERYVPKDAWFGPKTSC